MSNLNPWLVLLIGFVIGWFAQWLFEVLYFRRKRTEALRQVEEMQGTLKAREAELGAERERAATLQMENEALRAAIASQQITLPAVEASLPVAEAAEPEQDSVVSQVVAAAAVAAAAVAGDGEPLQMDELDGIAGLADPFKEKLCAAGICTVDTLANATVEQIDVICQEPDHSRPDYASWVLQAQELLVADGKWTYDDLSEIEGIDPTYAAILNEQGFTSFERLAAADEAGLAHIIAAPPWRAIRYSDWIAQAKLAAAGDKAGLEALLQQQEQASGDNLLAVEGIDDAMTAALAGHGIASFAALAAATPGQLAEISQEAGLPPGAYESWIAEAELRAAGKHVRRTKQEHVPAGDVTWTSCPQYLSQVKGVSPIYERRLYAASIGTYWELANLADDALSRILAPQPWQDVDLASIKAAAAQLAEDTDAVGRVWDGSLPDDLCQIQDLSRMYEARLHEAGICTFEALSEATPDQLAGICKAPEWKTPDYAGWMQAALARSGGAAQ